MARWLAMCWIAATPVAQAATVHGQPTREPPPGAVALTAAPPQTVELTLPFAGIWGVLQGIDSAPTHVGYAAYALDFVPAERLTARAPVRRRLQDFPCFGRDVLAAADGIVVWAEDGAADDPPVGTEAAATATSPTPPPPTSTSHRRPARRPRGGVTRHSAGNFVIVQHAAAEYTEYRHLQSGSVRVVVGQRVQRAQPVGHCGNSGGAGTPHLHVGLLGSVDPIATRPMRFSRYEVLGPAGDWKTGDGVPRPQQILRSVMRPPIPSTVPLSAPTTRTLPKISPETATPAPPASP